MCVEVGYKEAVRDYHRYMRLSVPNQEQGNFFTMMEPTKRVKLKDSVRVEPPPKLKKDGTPKKRPTKKKKQKGPSKASVPIQRTVLDLSEQKVTTLEEKNACPACFGEYNERCEGPDYCGEEFFEKCRRGEEVSER
jgi:hypothetical protein